MILFIGFKAQTRLILLLPALLLLAGSHQHSTAQEKVSTPTLQTKATKPEDPALKAIVEKLKEKDLPAALNLVNKFIVDKPGSPIGYFYRGQIYQTLGQKSQALIDLGTAIKLEPKFAQAYLLRSRLYREMKEYEKSKQDLLKVNEFLPDKMKAKPERLDAMYKDYDAMRSKIEKDIPSLKLCKEADQANRSGDTKTALKLYNQVLPKLEVELVKLKDQDDARFIKGNTYYNRAYCYLTSGYYKEALADLNKSIEYSPNFLDSRKNRAKLYELLKRPDLAKPDRDKIVELEAIKKKHLEMLKQKYAKKAEH